MGSSMASLTDSEASLGVPRRGAGPAATASTRICHVIPRGWAHTLTSLGLLEIRACMLRTSAEIWIRTTTTLFFVALASTGCKESTPAGGGALDSGVARDGEANADAAEDRDASTRFDGSARSDAATNDDATTSSDSGITPCRANGAFCTEASDCCSLHCDGTRCAPSSACLPPGEACAIASHCCSNLCVDDGHGRSICLTTGACRSPQ